MTDQTADGRPQTADRADLASRRLQSAVCRLPSSFAHPVTQTIAGFLGSLGIEMRPANVDWEPRVPGLDIAAGVLLVDESRLVSPADPLHEGGHIALSPRAEWPSLHGWVETSPAQEICVLAWQWAAAQHIGIDPALMFHDKVPSGNGSTLLENFRAGYTVGVPGLQRWGMTRDYPRMLRWTRD